MQAQFPREAGLAAQEGNCQHSLAADLIYKPGPPEEYVGVYRLNDILVTEEHYNNAKRYADHVRLIAGDGAHIEETISAPNIHPESFGTCDAWFYSVKARTLHVWDFKSGFTRVDAFENWQLINYAAGLVSNPNGPAKDAVKVVLWIVQPNDFGPDGPIKVWETNVQELADYFTILKASAKAVFSEKPTATNGRHCQYCLARHACEAKRLGAFDAFQYVCEPMPRRLNSVELGEELKVLLRAKEEIEHRLTGLETQVETMIKQGQQVPQFELRSKSHKQEWTIPIEHLTQFEHEYKLKLTKTTPVTPKQAIAAGLPEQIVNLLTKTKPGRKYLVPYDADKNARKLNNARK